MKEPLVVGIGALVFGAALVAGGVQAQQPVSPGNMAPGQMGPGVKGSPVPGGLVMDVTFRCAGAVLPLSQAPSAGRSACTGAAPARDRGADSRIEIRAWDVPTPPEGGQGMARVFSCASVPLVLLWRSIDLGPRSPSPSNGNSPFHASVRSR
jgi:hypothetical protein